MKEIFPEIPGQPALHASLARNALYVHAQANHWRGVLHYQNWFGFIMFTPQAWAYFACSIRPQEKGGQFN